MATAKYSPENRKKTSWDPLMLWVRPKHCCIHAIADHIRNVQLTALASIGCGTGLLEWLIHRLTGISVKGYEINADWWKSSYSPPTFIPLTFVENVAVTVPSSHVLMCCYFNNGKIFRKYVDAYDGPAMIIIGSIDNARCTDPQPFDYEYVHPWTLTHTHNITESDIIGFYIRDQQKLNIINRLRM